ncbi:MAG TPA: DegT/DnrJ/EryC1/StrS family aminotransferase [Myxococcales bacterium]|nr:DegT/DnrJ/EryC1/StrS family aminotransferase [Myxococcales bacterium]
MATTAAQRMTVTEGLGERAPVPRRVVPCMPTIWPHMLRPRPASAAPPVFPFDQPQLRYRYFARNAVWDAVELLGLAGKEVLFPAYHHGVELETLLAAGVKPLFFRVDAQMRCDFEDAKRRLTAQTAALYLIHYAGFPQDLAAARALADFAGVPLLEDCALSLLSRGGGTPLGATGEVSVFCLYKTLPVPNGGALLARGALRDRLGDLVEPDAAPVASTASHLIGGLLSNLELRAGPAGQRVRQAMRGAGSWAVHHGHIPRVSTGTQHFSAGEVRLGMSHASRWILRNQDYPGIVERRRRNYFLLYAALRDIAPPVTGELMQGVCPLFYPVRLKDKAQAMARLIARGVETVDFWRVRHPAVALGEFPEVDALRAEVLELPVHQDLSPADAEHVAQSLREVLA